jgi:hypothetical protein
MANTMTLIASSTVGAGGASSIDFTSIPSTYTDLVIKLSARTNNGSSVYDRLDMQFNSDTATNYKSILLYGLGSGTPSSDNGGGALNSIRFFYGNGGATTANTFSSSDIYIPNYASSNQKSASLDSVVENNATSNIDALDAGLWTGTSTINAIKLFNVSNNFVQYSTAYLYGVKNA